MTRLLQPFRRALWVLVRPEERVLVGVSGGADSLALLDLSARVARSRRIELIVAHVDHGWRADSGEDAEFVAREAAARGLACVVERADGLGSTEAAARAARLGFWARLACERGASGVLVGHTADDQAETVLLHLLRGTGTLGPAGMRADTTLKVDGREVRLLRPLLGLGRTDLRAYLRERGLVAREDPTNSDPAFLRNRVRHELLPLLTELQPRAAEALARLAEVAADDAALVAAGTEAAWRAVVREGVAADEERGAGGQDGAGGRAIDVEERSISAGRCRLLIERAPFRGLGPAAQRAVLRRVAEWVLGPANEVTLERIEAARAALIGGRGGSVIEWPGPLRLRIVGGVGTFERGA